MAEFDTINREHTSQEPGVVPGQPILECREVSAGYGSVRVVRDVSFSLTPGKVLAVLGPNGAGKSTLMNTLAGLLPRKGGEVIVEGKALRSGRWYGAW